MNKASVNTAFSILPGKWLVLLPALAIFFIQLLPASPVLAETALKPLKFSVLIYGGNRLDALAGFQQEMTRHEEHGGYIVTYDIRNAQNDRTKLPEMAKEIITSKPDIAIAGGGVEADALKAASAGTDIPVVFLAVTAAVDRGLVRDLRRPGGNLTGIEANDAELTGKRLWYITKILPHAKKITIFHVPDIGASVQSLHIARQTAEALGLELTVLEGKSQEDIITAAATISTENTDVLLITPVATVDGIMREYLLPLSLEKKIPIMGYNEGTLKNGAFASYAGSRYEMGRQAVSLVHKIIKGQSVADIAVETPDKIEFIINRWMINKLELKLPNKIWRMADRIENISF